MKQDFNLIPLLDFIDPAQLSYTEWLSVGMALQLEGYTVDDWENWSRRDPGRFHPGECERKWKGFNSSGSPVTGATITQMAKEGGWTPTSGTYSPEGYALDWNDTISYKPITSKREAPALPHPPENWDGTKDLTRYLETLFDSTDIVGYVTESWERDGSFYPSKGNWNYTAGEIIDQLNKHNGDLGAVLGDYNPAVGAWIRFNPLDGNGCMNENVRGFRFALVESDTMDLEDQYRVMLELELPIACLVHSGKKSLHAIVRVDADTKEEYSKRVDQLYDVCARFGLKVDKQNRNPSRLSRMPGVMRNGNPQYLIATNIGKESWVEWKEWIDSIDDSLPDPESMASVWDNLPALAPPLIDGILRQGHKMLLAGPSKAGKSYALIELSIAIAEGRSWMGFSCAQGRVLYVNLELDRASCLHRFQDVYKTLRWPTNNLDNLDIWNLRGKSIPMDKLAPPLIRRARNKGYIAVIIDPIYKVITGDENSADQMAAFCNQFDKVCTELSCAVIYCHHHSKGSQGQKRSMDRASGSGVFARDPDALLDLIELEVSDDLRSQQESEAVCVICREELARAGLLDRVEPDDQYREQAILTACENLLGGAFAPGSRRVQEARKAAQNLTAWRIEGTLREFPKFPPVNAWFDYPVHKGDSTGILSDLEPVGETTWQSNLKKSSKRKGTAEDRKRERLEALETAYDALNTGGEPVTLEDVCNFMDLSERTVKDRVKEHETITLKGNILWKNQKKKLEEK